MRKRLNKPVRKTVVVEREALDKLNKETEGISFSYFVRWAIVKFLENPVPPLRVISESEYQNYPVEFEKLDGS